MRVESVALIVLTICVFLSFYFEFLVMQSEDLATRQQLVIFAISSIIATVIVIACLIIYATLKKVVSRT